MPDRGEPSPPSGRPGLRWGGDGCLDDTPTETGREPVDTERIDRAASEALNGALQPSKRPAAHEGVEYASFLRRSASFVVDEAAKTFIWLIILTFVAVLTGGVPQGNPGDPLSLLPRIILSLGYDWLFWSQGWTPGANVVGVRIVDAEGGIPGPRRATTRVFGSVLSGMAFFVGYLWMLRSPTRQTWHDRMAGTYVVMRDREAERREAERQRRD